MVKSERKVSHFAKSQSLVVMRLGKTERDVQETFDRLYTVKRKGLLRKAIEIERSESTKDQLQSLETIVVSRLKVFNSLNLSRSRKESYLKHLESALHNLTSSQPDLSPSKATLDLLELRYKQAKRDFDREIDYQETLEKMISDRKRNIAKKNLPIFALRRDLQRLKLKRRDNESDFLRVSMEFESLSTTVSRTKEQLDQQNSFHTVKLQEKTTHFRRRAEFMEFVSRQDQQKAIQAAIQRKEGEAKRLTREMLAVQRAEEMLENSKHHLELLKSFECKSEKLLKAVATCEIQQVLDYWKQLERQKSDLELSISACDDRMTALKTALFTLIEERKDAFANTKKEVKFDDRRIDSLFEEINRKEKTAENRQNKVKSTQIRKWKKHFSMIYVKFDGILMQITSCDSHSGRDLIELVTEVEAKLAEIVSDSNAHQ